MDADEAQLDAALRTLEGVDNDDAEDQPTDEAAPLQPMVEGMYYDAPSATSDMIYRIRLTGGVYVCSCPAWRNQKGSPERRGCKHLLARLGAAFERNRLGDEKPIRGRKKSTVPVPANEPVGRKRKPKPTTTTTTTDDSKTANIVPAWRTAPPLVFPSVSVPTSKPKPKKRPVEADADDDQPKPTKRKRKPNKPAADDKTADGKTTDKPAGNDEPNDDDDDDKPKPKPKPKKPDLLLAQKYEGTDITGYWMSEKLDGLRALWTGTDFVSRLGNRFRAPAWFTDKFPTDVQMDGELFAGRGKFQLATSIVRSYDESDRWKQLTFRVFDLPSVAGPFESRMDVLADIVGCGTNQPKNADGTPNWMSPYLRMVDQIRCTGGAALAAFADDVISNGGEGVMLRQPQSLYIGKRSKTLLKVKRFEDGEARIVDHQAGKGKHKGRLGALICKFVDGDESAPTFKIGTGFSDDQREQPPAVGTVITFKYQETTNDGLPRFPVFVGVPIDR